MGSIGPILPTVILCAIVILFAWYTSARNAKWQNCLARLSAQLKLNWTAVSRGKPAKAEGRIGSHQITIDSQEKSGHMSRATFTRIRILPDQPPDLFLTKRSDSVVAKALGGKAIELGAPQFDREVRLKGSV
ncbi:MAG: hypothetical protein KC561_20895, partial [Myxococcales bacterium]|nr:hypothetical protein [Myxococcales bacterium]